MAGLGRVDEAGAYAFELDAGALGELERLAEAAAGEELDGPREPGSGRFALDVGDGARLRWDPFTTPPDPVAAPGRPPARAAGRGPRAPARRRAAGG